MGRPKLEETQQVTMRLPVELLKQVDRYAARLDVERPGTKHNRTDAIRIALLTHLSSLPPLPEEAAASAALSKPAAKSSAKKTSKGLLPARRTP
jgi:hypothetical protein